MTRNSFLNSTYRFTRSHRPRLEKGLTFNSRKRIKKIWLSPSKLYNFMTKNTLVDWLNMYEKSSHCFTPSSFNLTEGDQTESFKNFIMNKGIEFESKVVNMIKSKHPSGMFAQLTQNYTLENYQKTLGYMKDGIPVIFSGCVRNNVDKTFGICDILIRSDYISTIFDNIQQDLKLEEYNETYQTTEEFIPAPKLNGNYHYRVIDIKFSTLNLASNGMNMLNNDKTPFYKSQLFIYNSALKDMQGYSSNCAYILGRKWNYRQGRDVYNGNDCVSRFGIVDFTSKHDSGIQEMVKEGMAWYRDLSQNGSKWSIDKPTRFELYPNMGVESGRWNTFKKELAENLGEITMIWQCGFKHRKIGHTKGIKSWKNKKCSAKTIGVSDGYAGLVDSIIHINRDSNKRMLPESFKKDKLKIWQKEGKNGDVFVDFETMSDLCESFDSLPYASKFVKKPEIFMIGVYSKEETKWKYRSFTCKKFNEEYEKEIMSDFYNFVKDKNVYYWHAEKMFWEKNLRKYPELNFDSLNFIDMCKVFKEEKIVLKNCFNYGLKSIAKNMYEYGMIKTHLESECSNGMMAMIKAWNCYNSCKNAPEHPVMKDIEKYNEFDCKVLWDILTYIRSKVV